MDVSVKNLPALAAGHGLAAAQEPQQYLTFNLAGETFAVGILAVKEIIEYGQLTSVPMMPGFVRGVINLRGAVVPVIDLNVRFGRPATVTGRRTCIVIIEVAGEESDTQVLGIVVDAVNEVLDIPADRIEPAPAFGARLRAEFIAGMGKVGDKFVIILNVRRVLSLDEMAALAGDGAAAALLQEAAA